MWRVGRASDQEGLRLMLAYLQIADPALRKQIVHLAEKHAGHPQPILLPDVAQDNDRPGDVDSRGAADDGSGQDSTR